MDTVFDFRLRISPRWDVLGPLLKERAHHGGLAWPSTLRAVQFAKMYALSLVGQQQPGAGNPNTTFDVLAWEPPKEPKVAENLTAFADLRVSLGVRQQKTWTAANAGKVVPFEQLALWLTGDGLASGAIAEATLGQQPLANIPYQAILDVMTAVATKQTRLKVIQSDHIVEHLVVPPSLAGFKLSHWRGDASYRLSHPNVDLEVWVKPR